MTEVAALTDLAHMAEGWIFPAALVFLRVGAVMALLPALGEASVPARVRLVLALGADGRVLQAAPVRVRLTADALREDRHARRDHLARLLGDAYAQQALAWRYPLEAAGPPQAALRRLRVPAEITLQQVAPGQRRPPPPFLGPAWRRVVPVDLAAPGWTSASLPAGAEATLSDTGALPDARIRKLGGAGTGAL